MADLTPIVCTTGPDLTRVDCDGTLVIPGQTTPTPDPITPPTVEDGIVPTNPTTDTPHAPPNPDHDPFPVIDFIAAGEAGYDSPSQFATTAIDDAGVMSGVPASYIYGSWTAGSRMNATNIAVSADGANVWVLAQGSLSGTYEWWLAHFDTSVDPFAPTKSYEYNIFDFSGKAHTGNARLVCYGAIFYSDVTKRLYVMWKGLDTLDVGIFVIDVSTPTATPTLISSTVLQSTNYSNIRGFALAEDERYAWYGEDQSVPSNACVLHNISISTDGATVALHGSPLTLDGTGRPSHAINLQLVDSNTLLASWGNAGQDGFASVDISTPGAESVLDTINFDLIYTGAGNDPRPQAIAINTLNTRAYQYVYAINGGGAGIIIIDISDPSNLSILNDFNRGAVSIPDQLAAGIGFIENDTGAQFLVMVGIETWDVTDDMSPTLIDTGGSANKNCVIAYPHGPKAFRIHANTSVLPVPVDANLAVVTGQKTGRGVAVVVGLDDYTAPVVQATVRETDLFNVYGPDACFVADGSLLCVLGPDTGTLQVYSTGATFALVGSLQDNSLIGAAGLVADATDETKIYTLIGAGTTTISLVVLDLTTPATPSIASTTDVGPSYYDGTGDYPELVGQTDGHFLLRQNGPALVSKATDLRTGDGLPAALRNARVVCIDATYAYVWNDYNGGGLAIIAYTTDALSLVGYLHLGTRTYAADEAVDVVKSGNYVYVLHTRSPSALTAINVTTPASPTLADELEVGDWPVELGLRSSTELVVFGQTTIYRVDITTPSALAVTASLGTGHYLKSGAVVNNKAVAFDNTGMAYSYSLGSPIVEEDSYDIGYDGDGGAEGFSFSGQDYVAVLHRGDLSYPYNRLIVMNVTTVAALTNPSQVEWPGKLQFWALDTTTRRGVIFDYQQAGDLVFAGYKGVSLYNPNAPAVYSRAYTPEATELDRNPQFVAVSGDTIVVSRRDDEGGIVVADISDLSDPTVVRWIGDLTIARVVSKGYTHPIRGTTNGIGVGYSPRFRIHTVTLNDEPRVGDYTQVLSYALLVAKQATALSDDGNYLFVGYKPQGDTDASYAVRCYDVSDPTAAVLLGSYTVGRAIQSIRVSGTSMVVFVTHGNVNQSPMFSILDFTDPYNPSLTGEVEVAGDEWVAQSLETY